MDGCKNGEPLDWPCFNPLEEHKKNRCCSLLILDAYRIHMMGSFVNQIQSLRIKIQHIMGACTWLYQPVDVGVNYPIKREMTEQWKKWMFDGGGVVDHAAKEPSQKLVDEWIIWMYKNASVEIGKNTWKK